MQIKRTSPFTGVTHEQDIPVTHSQLDAWQSGTLIQQAMPHLTPGQREFLMTGITEAEWDALFAEDI